MTDNHLKNINQANYHLSQLRNMNNPKFQFGYLRKHVSPYEFEEMVLTLFEEAGFPVRRNERYSGDGGSDGLILHNRKAILVQSKGYRNYISAKDVEDHSKLCKKYERFGVFVHTGRTGKKSRKVKGGNVDIISGRRLLNLINNRTVKLRFQPTIIDRLLQFIHRFRP